MIHVMNFGWSFFALNVIANIVVKWPENWANSVSALDHWFNYKLE